MNVCMYICMYVSSVPLMYAYRKEFDSDADVCMSLEGQCMYVCMYACMYAKQNLHVSLKGQ